uniref:Cytokine-inducible SH2-containing protein n=1 Tax=Timema tahoe TaxID=61484 RepID=A0A7R9IGC3_9NEOP|nr:unnamed protein product [Timema tahoe]
MFVEMCRSERKNGPRHPLTQHNQPCERAPETLEARHGAMLTTCPNCRHVFQHPDTSLAPCCQTPLLVSATLQLQVTPAPRAGLALAGGGIILQHPASAVMLQQQPITPRSPQPSPSTPLSFVLPTAPMTASASLFPWSSPVLSDLERIAATLRRLRASGWYHEGLSWQESETLLQTTHPGTFLVRDSNDPRFLFSLSVQTDRGPTSVRLHYVCGHFRLDAEPRLAPLLPWFDCVAALVHYYVAATRNTSDKLREAIAAALPLAPGKDQVLIDAQGHMYSHILLTTPLYKKRRVAPLQHLARLAINRQLAKSLSRRQTNPFLSPPETCLPLPPSLSEYVRDYPYCQ